MHGAMRRFNGDGSVNVVDKAQGIKRIFRADGSIVSNETADGGTTLTRLVTGTTVRKWTTAGNKVQHNVDGSFLMQSPTTAPGEMEQILYDGWRCVVTAAATVEYMPSGSVAEKFADCAANAKPAGVVAIQRDFSGLLEVEYRNGTKVQYNPTTQLVTETTARGSILQRLPNGSGLRCAVAGGRVAPVAAHDVAAAIASGACLLPAALGAPPLVGAAVSVLIDLPGAAQMTSQQVLALYGAGSRVSEASEVVVGAVTFDSGTRQTKYADGRIVDVCADATRITQYPCGRTVQVSVLLSTVTCYANRAHNLTRSP